MFVTALLLAMQVQSPRTPPQIAPDSYADSATAELVNRARSARERNERLVSSYSVRVSSRLGVGIRALARDRMLYRQEVVADIEWRRDSITTITAVGAREGVPVAEKGDHVPHGIDGDLRDLVIDPGSDYLRVIGEDDDGFIYPLRVGGETDYRFERGGTTTVTLPDGRPIELVALRVIPRRADFNLINGTLWFDNSTANLVRAVFRPARPFEMRRDLDEDELDDTPSWVNAGAEVKYVTIEYALYDQRWWLPRYMAIDAKGTMGNWLNAPFRMERVYEGYEVVGGSPPDSDEVFKPAGRPWIKSDYTNDEGEYPDSIQALVDECIREESARIDSLGVRVAVSGRIADCERNVTRPDENLTVVVPEDADALMTSEFLGEPILAMGDLISEAELLSLQESISDLPDRPWESTLILPRGAGALLQHARYNRVEALSLGLSGGIDFGRLQLLALARLGAADLEPNAELALVRPTLNHRYSVAGYRRLAAANPAAKPFGPINSFMSLFAGRDDGVYYRSVGAEVTGGNIESGWWSGRLYAERQTAANTETDFSLPGLLDKNRVFRQNITAQEADQVGGSLTLRGRWPLSQSVTVGLETTVDGETGEYQFGRGAVTARFYHTQGGPIASALTLSTGTSIGGLSRQRQFYLGGPSSLRGYDGGVVSGSAYWYARAEVGNNFPAARLIGFADIGWAGDRDHRDLGNTLVGLGIGASFMDGLVRLDLARAVVSPTGWRFDLYLDGAI